MVRQSSRRDLLARWNPECPLNLDETPFGYTSEGYKDHRGLPFREYRKIYGRRFLKCDLSYGDFSETRVKGAEFLDCRFTSADFTNVFEKGNRFLGCVFRSCSFRKADIGYGSSRYEDCVFENNDFSAAGFTNAVFRGTLFKTNRIKNSHFDATGFWDCTFVGLIEDVTFHGQYLFRSDRRRYGPPEDSGLHNVDFSQAEFDMVGFSHNCALENIQLPTDGSLCLIDSARFMNNLDNIKHMFPDCTKMLDDYVVIFSIDPKKQPRTIICLPDFETVVGKAFGKALYERVKDVCEVR